MHGNVWEWFGDWYYADYYRHSLTADPHDPQNGKYRFGYRAGRSAIITISARYYFGLSSGEMF